MTVYRPVDAVPDDFGACVLTIGNFDGVHVGHRHIFERVAKAARENGWTAAALTFDPHPTRVVAPERSPKLMTTIDERCRLMAECRTRCAKWTSPF